jgi:hypothetical protein
MQWLYDLAAQYLKQSRYLRGQKIEDEAQFQAGVKEAVDGLLKILGSMKLNVFELLKNVRAEG